MYPYKIWLFNPDKKKVRWIVISCVACIEQTVNALSLCAIICNFLLNITSLLSSSDKLWWTQQWCDGRWLRIGGVVWVRNLILSGAMLNNRPGKWIQGTACLPNVEQASQIFLEQRNRKKSNAKSLGSRKILVKS